MKILELKILEKNLKNKNKQNHFFEGKNKQNHKSTPIIYSLYFYVNL